jgi:hypothetical protein
MGFRRNCTKARIPSLPSGFLATAAERAMIRCIQASEERQLRALSTVD